MTIPPITIAHPEDGFFHIGKETSGRTKRKKQVQVAGGSGASLRIFQDGGWELRSVSNDKGSNLLQQGDGPLNIYSDGDINVNCLGEFSVKASKITMETTSDEGDIVLNAKRNIRLDADNNITFLGTNVTTKASQTFLAHSDGWNILSGNPVYTFTPKSKLIPSGVGDIVQTLLDNILLS